MKTNKRRSFFKGIPSWAMALFAMLIIMVLIFVLPDVWGESAAGEVLAYIMLVGGNTICCFFIVKHNPKSVWYVPVIINAYLIIYAFAENHNLKGWLFICGLWVLSIIASIIGAWMGKRTSISDNP